MDISKSYEFFQPESVQEDIHIIGVGATGSTLTKLLTRLGLTKFTLWDFDIVSPHNIANQQFRDKDIGIEKTVAMYDIINEINPTINSRKSVTLEGKWEGQKLTGYVFLCVDNIDLRREIVEKNKYNDKIKAMFDYRLRLEDGQLYAADWGNLDSIKALLSQMQFSHEEAMEETPVSACNMPLSVMPTVECMVALGVGNFVNFTKTGELKQMMWISPFKMDMFAI